MSIKFNFDGKGKALRVRFTYLGGRYSFFPGLENSPRGISIFQDEIALRILADIENGTFDRTLKSYKRVYRLKIAKGVTFRALFNEWLECPKQTLKDEATRTKYKRMLTTFDEFFDIDKKVVNLTDRKDIEKYIKFLYIEKHNKWGTIRTKINLLKRLFSFAVTKNYIRENPCTDIEELIGTDVKQRRKPFTKDEVRRILDYFYVNFDRQSYHLIFFSFNTGLRLGETLGLKWSQLSEDLSTITVDNINDKQPKNKRVRSFNLSSSVTSILESQKILTGTFNCYVFCKPDGAKINIKYFVESKWTETLKKLNIEYRPLYTTRHTFVSHDLKRNNDPLRTSAITGHSPKTMFDVYASEVEALSLSELLFE